MVNVFGGLPFFNNKDNQEKNNKNNQENIITNISLKINNLINEGEYIEAENSFENNILKLSNSLIKKLDKIIEDENLSIDKVGKVSIISKTFTDNGKQTTRILKEIEIIEK